ncbi:MAG: MFS transporter [Nitrospirae bacterium]|nr:MFS transporter [Nitrospirota bacterium]
MDPVLNLNFYLLVIAAITFGLGESFVTSSSAALVADVCKEKHFGTAMGTFGTIFDVGHASGPIVAGFLLARFDYFYSFIYDVVFTHTGYSGLYRYRIYSSQTMKTCYAIR